MPPSDAVQLELEQLRAKVRRQSLVIVTLSIITIGSLIGLGVILSGILSSSEDDERPPVIVTSGGSIKIEAQERFKSDGTSLGRGHFEKIGNEFAHKPDPKITTGSKKFEVVFVNATCRDSAATPLSVTDAQVFTTKKLDFTYEYPDSDSNPKPGMFAIYTDSTDLFVSPQGNPDVQPTANNDYTIYAREGQDAYFKKVSFIAMGMSYTDPIVCTFNTKDYAASMTIFQKKKN